MDSGVEVTLGAATVVCLVLVLVPQVLHNYQRRSVEGLSLSTVAMWHLACCLVTGYLVASDAAFAVFLGFAIETSTFVVIEAQFVMYKDVDEACARGGVVTLVAGTVVATVVVVCSCFVCSAFPSSLGLVVGSVIPSVLFAAGFMPQFYEIAASGSGAGVSLALIGIDLFGCLCGVSTVLMTTGDAGAAAVFLVNIVCLLVLAALVFAYPGEGARAADAEGDEEAATTKATTAAGAIATTMVPAAANGTDKARPGEGGASHPCPGSTGRLQCCSPYVLGVAFM